MQASNQYSAARSSGRKRGQTRDIQTYQVMPETQSPPSPTYTQSTLTHSGSTSNSASTPSTSPQQPVTPPRNGRARRQYGELGRVPLHRRGTSQTYERLEDLLREAGYKETRIFTPETDRMKGEGDEELDNEQDQKGPIGALVNFISGLIPSAAASHVSLVASPDEDFIPTPLTRQNTEDSSRSLKSPLTWSSPTISPLSNRTQRQNTSDSQLQYSKRESGTPPQTSSPGTMTSSIESIEFTPRPPQRQVPPRTITPVPQINLQQPQLQMQHPSPRRPTPSEFSHSSGFARPNHLRQQGSRTSLMPKENGYVSPPGSSLYNPTPQSPLVYPMPSRAGAYLRHIASNPAIPRPSSTPVGAAGRKRTSTRRTLVLNDTDDEEDRPPMPKTWLETVAKAVLFGGLGAHVGGPSSSSDHSSSSSTIVPSVKTLRPTRSSLSQVSPQQQRRSYRSQHGLLSDRTNTTVEESESERNSQFLAPPDLFLKLGTGKASATTTEAKHRVLCRSAPTSRANSRVRGSPPGDRRTEKPNDVGGRAKERVGRRSSWKGNKRVEKDRVPSLANTDVEGDDELPWSPRGHKHRKIVDNRDPRHFFGGGALPTLGMTNVLGGGDHDQDMDMASPSEDDNEDDEDEDDEVVDLARILVPPKRQNSIKSLRRHLEGDTGPEELIERLRGRAASTKFSAPNSANSTNARKTRSGESSQENMSYDGTEAEECQWGGGWVKGGGGSKGRRGMGTGEEEFHEREFSRGGKFDSGRSILPGTSRRAALPGWGA